MPKQLFSSPVFPSKWKQVVLLDRPAGVGSTCSALPSALGRVFAVKGRSKRKTHRARPKGVFSFPFHLKNFEFWFIILQNKTKHHAKFLAKRYPFSILDFGLKRPKKSQKAKKALTHLMKNLAFWMELNTPKKNGILHFIILK
jgi:hypothetical protein